MAATLANGGICPITDEQLLSANSVRDTLSLMHSCGMYNYSGEFAFKVSVSSSIAGFLGVSLYTTSKVVTRPLNLNCSMLKMGTVPTKSPDRRVQCVITVAVPSNLSLTNRCFKQARKRVHNYNHMYH